MYAGYSEIFARLGWGSIAAYGVAVVASAASVAALWYSRRGHIGVQVDDKIDARIGRVFRDLSDTIREVSELRQEVTEQSTAAQTAVKRAEEAAMQIDELRQRWSGVLPAIETLERGPDLLLQDVRRRLEEARSDSSKLSDVIVLLNAVLEHPEADSKDLEDAGDIARLHLRSPGLARRLYSRAVEEDSENLSALAELLYLRAQMPADRVSARQELEKLVRANPRERNPLEKLLNLLMDRDAFEEMRRLTSELLASGDSPYEVLLLRNLGVALEFLGEPDQDVREAYERAVSTAEKAGDEPALVNAAIPYIRFIMSSGQEADHERAEDLLNRILRQRPTVARLHYLKGEVLRQRGAPVEALKSYDLAQKLGDPGVAQAALDAIREIAVLEEAGLGGTAPSGRHLRETPPA